MFLFFFAKHIRVFGGFPPKRNEETLAKQCTHLDVYKQHTAASDVFETQRFSHFSKQCKQSLRFSSKKHIVRSYVSMLAELGSVLCQLVVFTLFQSHAPHLGLGS